MSDLFANPLEEMIEFQDLKTDLQRGQGPLLVTGCLDSQKVHLLSELSDLTPWKLIVTYDDSRAREICEDYRCFDTDISLYPARDLLFYTSDIHGNLLTKQRIQVMRRLAWMKGRSLTIGAEDVVEVGKLTHALAEMGYEKVAQVEGSGQFSVRGGIIDIFPLTEEVPYRIELWGDEVDSIRTFDPESQRSIEQVDEAVIYPDDAGADSGWNRGDRERPQEIREKAPGCHEDGRGVPDGFGCLGGLRGASRGLPGAWAGKLYPVFLQGNGIVFKLFSSR